MQNAEFADLTQTTNFYTQVCNIRLHRHVLKLNKE